MAVTRRDTLMARRRKMFTLADEIGLTREDRIELSRVLLWRDITSWSQLDDAQVARMLDALEGYQKISWLKLNA